MYSLAVAVYVVKKSDIGVHLSWYTHTYRFTHMKVYIYIYSLQNAHKLSIALVTVVGYELMRFPFLQVMSYWKFHYYYL